MDMGNLTCGSEGSVSFGSGINPIGTLNLTVYYDLTVRVCILSNECIVMT